MHRFGSARVLPSIYARSRGSRSQGFRSWGGARSLAVQLGSVSCLLAIANSGQAAERIYVSYNLLERSIPVASLAAYARQGTIDENLAVYAQFAGAEAMKQLKTGLLAKAEVDPVVISQFLYSPQGESLLRRLGQVIQTESRDSGLKAIRAALILSAADPEGLTPLNILRKFPTRGIRIDVRRSLEIASALQTAVSQTNLATALIAQTAALEAELPPTIAFNQLPDLRQFGAFTWQTRTFTDVIDLDRPAYPRLFGRNPIQNPLAVLPGRQFPVDLYLPSRRFGQNAAPAPVVVISHGLGSDRATFVYLARHLASYGFAVLVPEHPGSSSRQLEALIDGTASEVAAPSEFIDRPLDVTFLLNYMEERVKTDPTLQGRLNLQQVGVVGQSFGGYTALALAGATINPAQLRVDCPNADNELNISLLLQCRAQQITPLSASLSDRRVKAVLAMNPVDSVVFGREGMSQIQVPTLILAGSADTVAPALPEQIQPFTWLTTNDKFLVLINQGTHFSVFAGADGGAIALPEEVVGPNPAIARRYVSALSVAFFQTYLANQVQFRPYLSAAYAEAISEAPLSLSLIRTLTSEQLAQTVGGEFPSLPPIGSETVPRPPAP